MPNRKRKCRHCGDYSPVESGVLVPLGYFCSLDHAAKHGQAKATKARERELAKAKREHTKARKAVRKENRDLKRRDLRYQHKLTQPVFNKMRVLEELIWFAERGQEPTCISCAKPLGGDQWCCGHFKTRGAQSGLRYDRKNTFLQHNYKCNMNMSGDIAGTKTTRGYKQGLLDRFGETDGQAIIDHCETNTKPVKWAWQDLEQFRAECNARIRELEETLAKK